MQALAQEPAGQGCAADAVNEVGPAVRRHPVRRPSLGDADGDELVRGVYDLFAAKIVLEPGRFDFPAEPRGFAVVENGKTGDGPPVVFKGQLTVYLA